jgi:hypothetical protein
MRDALPALDHGRLPAGGAARARGATPKARACAAELTLLRGARSALVGRGPTVDSSGSRRA